MIGQGLHINLRKYQKGKIPWITINAENFIGNYEKNSKLEHKHLIAILTHELGHVVGLDHTGLLADIMYPSSDMEDYIDQSARPSNITSDDRYLINNLLYVENTKKHQLIWYAW